MGVKVAHNWRLRGQRYRLEGEVCDHCDAVIFPPRDICPECHQPAKTEHTLSGRGEVYTYSTVKRAGGVRAVCALHGRAGEAGGRPDDHRAAYRRRAG